jgi:hypothetical protein
VSQQFQAQANFSEEVEQVKSALKRIAEETVELQALHIAELAAYYTKAYINVHYSDILVATACIRDGMNYAEATLLLRSGIVIEARLSIENNTIGALMRFYSIHSGCTQ